MKNQADNHGLFVIAGIFLVALIMRKSYKRGLLSSVFSQRISSYELEVAPYPFSDIAQRRKEKYDPRYDKMLPCIELEHIEQETGRIIGSVPSVQQSSIKNTCKPGDTLFGKLRPYLRKYAYVQEEIVCSSEIWVLVPSENVTPEYLFYLVQTNEFIKNANISSGTKMPRAEWDNIVKTTFFIPSKIIQSQIVELLTLLDKKIQCALDQYDFLLREKAGLLQQLFI